MTQTQKNWTIFGVIVAAIIGAIAIFRYERPGVYMRYKCNQSGDDTRKFYDPNFKARGAVCDGLYIPIGSNLQGINSTTILGWMEQIIIDSKKPIPQTYLDMKKFVNETALYVKSLNK